MLNWFLLIINIKWCSLMKTESGVECLLQTHNLSKIDSQKINAVINLYHHRVLPHKKSSKSGLIRSTWIVSPYKVFDPVVLMAHLTETLGDKELNLEAFLNVFRSVTGLFTRLGPVFTFVVAEMDEKLDTLDKLRQSKAREQKMKDPIFKFLKTLNYRTCSHYQIVIFSILGNN